MLQTPVHEFHNSDLLAAMPLDARAVIEVGCSSGALAREYKKLNPDCEYTGIEIDYEYARLAERYCDRVLPLDIETASESFFKVQLDGDCWVFGDTLEHFRDPWRILACVRNIIPTNGCVVACIPNAQHYSVQMKLNGGDFWYEDSGLLDRTHLRWFTRKTIFGLFGGAGFSIVSIYPRLYVEAGQERILDGIREMAVCAGKDADIAVSESLVQQYVVKAIPV